MSLNIPFSQDFQSIPHRTDPPATLANDRAPSMSRCVDVNARCLTSSGNAQSHFSCSRFSIFPNELKAVLASHDLKLVQGRLKAGRKYAMQDSRRCGEGHSRPCHVWKRPPPEPAGHCGRAGPRQGRGLFQTRMTRAGAASCPPRRRGITPSLRCDSRHPRSHPGTRRPVRPSAVPRRSGPSPPA